MKVNAKSRVLSDSTRDSELARVMGMGWDGMGRDGMMTDVAGCLFIRWLAIVAAEVVDGWESVLRLGVQWLGYRRRGSVRGRIGQRWRWSSRG